MMLLVALPTLLGAQGAPVRVGVMYACPDPLRFKVLSCAGADPSSPCDLQGFNLTRAARRGTVLRSQVAALLQPCHLQSRAEAEADARVAPSQQGAANGQMESNGIKVGDEVEALTGFGWTPAKVLAISGNSYRVTVNGIAVTKDYPSEVRRVGGLTARDHANGQYVIGDYVQVNVQGQWTNGKIVATSGNEYQVALPGNRAAWAGPENLRPGVAPPSPAAPKAGVPPKPGLVSCAGKIEGRYATSGSFGSFQITFRSGKATLTDMGGNEEVFECWTGGGKLYLHQPGNPNLDMPIDINDDGTLQTPMGELKKKGS
jgi:hypothetical protein